MQAKRTSINKSCAGVVVMWSLTDGTSRISVDPHKQLVQLLVVKTFAKYFTKGCNKLETQGRKIKKLVNYCKIASNSAYLSQV